MTTVGWELLVKWNNGTSVWIYLKDLNASIPVALEKYAIANEIFEEPTFNWWVRQML